MIICKKSINIKQEDQEQVIHKWSCISRVILCMKLQLFIIILLYIFFFFLVFFFFRFDNHGSDKIFTYALVNHIKQQEQPVFSDISFYRRRKMQNVVFYSYSLVLLILKARRSADISIVK